MPLCPACLLVLGVALGVSVPGGCCGFHSLHYFYLRLLEPSQELPPSFLRGYLDDQPITRYDSLTRRVEPLVSWMEELEKETFLPLEWVFRSELEELPGLNHLTDGLHTWQVILGCEFREDGNKDGLFRYGYDGMDFISFKEETLRWVAAQPQARKFKEKWDEDPEWSHENKIYLEETCILWLQRYLSYRKEALRKIEPPVGKVTRRVVDDSLEVLICQAFGFYPKEIQATWTRDGENWEQETFRRNVAPNSDGTYYVWISIEIDPKERDRFMCHLEHDGLQEPLVLAWKEETGWCWRRRTILSREVRISPPDFPLKPMALSGISDTEEIVIQARSAMSIEMKVRIPYVRLRYQLDREDPVLTLRKREGKEQRLKRPLSWSGDLETVVAPLPEPVSSSGEDSESEEEELEGLPLQDTPLWQCLRCPPKGKK
ncbi:major histocompatibility complex class I-related gene protein-like isoform X2 [Pantherophis guttatus]|uniref:Major histocompatibility complex class I-related gene protein-like isoform X2 n=1 Tax=Pantherophis guttatus TaxID=94885 RepID=A0ABM3ZM68_PANGU|nr:major histocompatibility complex class I-related gene protein-like isoform X2 [Pantherophis guttatus]